MNIEIHGQGGAKIAEVISNELLISNPEEGLQLLVDLYYQDFDKIIIHKKILHPIFSILKLVLPEKFFKNSLIIVSDLLLLVISQNIKTVASEISFLKVTKAVKLTLSTLRRRQ